jgi:HicB-like protein involved in pilus formation
MAAQQEQAPERSPDGGQDAPGHSGRLLVRMPATLHAELAQVARREGVSLNALVIGALSGAVGWRSPDAARTERAGDAREVSGGGAPAPPAAAPPAAAPPAAAAPSRTLSVALAVNLVVVLLAAAAAIGLVIAAWPS